MQKLYAHTVRTMATSIRRLQRPVHLVLDFDATLTIRDTIILLREVPVQRNKRLGYEAYRIPEWSSLESAYMKDYEGHKATEVALDANDNGSSSFVDQAKRYSQMLARRRVLEEQSMLRLEAWEFFRGVKRADVCKAAETVLRDGRLQMRDQWSDMLRMFLPHTPQSDAGERSKVSIISLNWSKTFVRECLLSALKLEQRDHAELRRFIVENLQIHSCEITGIDDHEGSSGKMQADVLSSADKLKLLPPACRKVHPIHADRPQQEDAPSLVHVGDSSTDFDCLVAADTGIWLCPANNLSEASGICEQTFKPLKLRVRPIDEAANGGLARDELVWARNFEQIAAFLSSIAP